ncbi:uncharacterized protein STEHIDRAFT_118392 [Stereum hirsutum FP-91666 SS1]|uniref:uncharacterized protein n=1 Tax=Stereum hirsutum (strain FP-91666) TaxID=721885 RepID=UPI000440A08B|nr:uncharacterized protein STEHIDRAFT_118392 [Stereum hirsutum FP-91666 SS1]EIM91290.1 hypothetical protein STEHIDRAFT_118392 [Stereum hirsutum FP-91666 SS1]
MFKHTKPSIQGAQRQRGPSPSYPERQSLPPTRDSVPNNYVPSVRKTSAAAPSAQSQPPLYHPSQYDLPSQTNYALARTGASVPAAMSPFAAAKNFNQRVKVCISFDTGHWVAGIIVGAVQWISSFPVTRAAGLGCEVRYRDPFTTAEATRPFPVEHVQPMPM